PTATTCGEAARAERRSVGGIVAGAGPRRQHDQNAGAARARQRVPLGRLEAHEAAWAELDALRVGGDLDVPLDHDDPRVLLDLVLAERLPGLERDQHRACSRILVHDVRVAGAARRVDRAQIPVLHGPDLLTGAPPEWPRP